MKTSVLKNYRVLKKLGQGGMGMVYLAEDVVLGRQVALKFLAPYLVQDPEIMGRFRAEARNQARLVHPHITLVYAFQEFEEQAFLVLEYLDGETLEARIQRQGKIPVQECVAIMGDILSAMSYSHKKGVVHRDIKPGNIGFTADGRVKLMDFGIALDVDETQRLTRTGHTLGTPHYMAPEQILGQPADGRADIYALGITLFEMLTGRVPFEGSDYEVRVAQINHPPPSPCAAGCPDLPAAIEAVVLKALAKDPAERFATAGEFRRALEAAASPRPPVERPRPAKKGRSTEVLQPQPPAPQTTGAAAESPLPAAAPQTAGPVVASLPPASPGQRRWRVLAPVTLGLAAMAGTALFLGYPKFSEKSLTPKAAVHKTAPEDQLKKPELEIPAKPDLPPTPPATKISEVSLPAKSQPPPEKPKVAVSLPAPVAKPEIKKESDAAATLPPPDYKKIVMGKLKDNNLFGLKVVQDEKQRITISGTVKSQSQKNKVIQVVSAAELYVPVDYELVVAAEKRPKPAPSAPRRPRESLSEDLEAPKSSPKPDLGALRPGSGEIKRKPLPPRLD
jgi:serine/threonine protein kinase